MKKIAKPLTDKQKEFVRLLVESDGELTKTECAKRAGYEDGSAYQRAYELTNPKICPNVVNEISKYKSEYLEKYKISEPNHISFLGKLRDEARSKGMIGVAVRAEELRGKCAGFYIDKLMTMNRHNILDASEEELEGKMKKIIEDYGDWINAEEKNKQ